ncbi:MAG: c-type cytochrome [Candidatus Sulfopaludibacter sp.]|nr:c-type cytochrome [Candidatus Sulfopaludibacter sp.]
MKRLVAVAVCAFAMCASGVIWAQPPEQTGAGAARGGGRGGRGGRGGGGRGPTFPQQTRALASPEVIARGKAVYGVNCGACHGADLRGGDQGGPSLLRSLSALSDQHGETIGPIVRGSRQDKGMPAFNLNEDDVTAVAEYIHSVLAQVGTQARPPGAVDPDKLNVLVGNASAGQTYFQAKCASCHSVAGDLKSIASRYSDPRTLQNTWVSGGGGGGRRGGGENAKPSTVTVTLANGQKLEGILVRKDDFIVTMILPDGSRRSIARDGDAPKVEVHDPNEAHKKLVPALTDDDMHNVTAYLATVK